MNPIMQNFIIESRDLIESAARGLLALEANPDDKAIINELFREIHTVKGASGILDNIAPFTQLAHRMEDLMQKVRDGHVALNGTMLDLMLGCCDQFLLWIEELEQHQDLSAEAVSISKQMIAQLAPLTQAAPTHTPTSAVAAQEETATLSISELTELLGRDCFNDVEALLEYPDALLLIYTPDKQCFFSGDDPLAWMRSVEKVSWRKVVLIPDSEPFDTYQAQMQFLLLTQSAKKDLEQQLAPIDGQYRLYRIQSDNLPTAPIDQRTQYVERIVKQQIALLREEQVSESVRAGTFLSIKNLYCALSQQISDRPAPLPESVSADELITLFDNILLSFARRTAIIDKCENEPAQPSAITVNEQLDKVKKKQIKTLKVDQEKVDLLMDLVGELIVAKNSMQYLAYRAENEFGVRKLAQDIKAEQSVISRLAEDLQSVVMQVRMVPLATVFQRYPRLIRDISRKLGKQVDLIIEGEDTEADKSIVEDLSEPLVHLIRNALDHGIESPDIRREQGKNPTGKITLSAFTLDDSVIIKMSDDGKGVDVERVKTKALERGLVEASKLERMSQQEIIHLIFEPGFSTVEQVSDLSGRGVGMDAVRTAIERNGGTLTLSSEPGKGSEITMILPLSMTISRVMMFELEQQSFAIPIESVIQTLKISRHKDIRRVKNLDTFILRGETVPILYLKRAFEMNSAQIYPDIQPILVVRVGDDVLGLAVDRLQEGQDVIIKPLEGALATFSIYRGAAIMGDGRVLLVLDTEEVVKHAR
ncbi:chemotaxis protein CheA [Vibrio cholerae]|nr:chemotaxis protein CheA [Vibrio cholerae]